MALAKAFISVAPFFKLYSQARPRAQHARPPRARCLRARAQYCGNYSKAIATVKRCKEENPDFEKVLSQKSQEHGTLESYLIKPVQRLTKYPLFFNELLKVCYALLCLLCYAMLCDATLCCAMLCHAVLCCAVLSRSDETCYAMTCYVVLC